MVIMDSMQKPETHWCTRNAYDRMVAGGVLTPGERVELICGEIVNVKPQGAAHAVPVRLAQRLLQSTFGKGFDVSVQLPLALYPVSEPEPDLAVVRGRPQDSLRSHTGPSVTVLIVEAPIPPSHTIGRRKGVSTRAGIPECWVVNLTDRQLEVWCRHQASVDAPFGWKYADPRRLGPDDSVSPPGAPSSSFVVSDLLP
jgi:Uma2 family endonuclease